MKYYCVRRNQLISSWGIGLGAGEVESLEITAKLSP